MLETQFLVILIIENIRDRKSVCYRANVHNIMYIALGILQINLDWSMKPEEGSWVVK